MTYSIASESLGGGVCFQACLLVCKGLGLAKENQTQMRSICPPPQIQNKLKHVKLVTKMHSYP